MKLLLGALILVLSACAAPPIVTTPVVLDTDSSCVIVRDYGPYFYEYRSIYGDAVWLSPFYYYHPRYYDVRVWHGGRWIHHHIYKHLYRADYGRRCHSFRGNHGHNHHRHSGRR